MGALGGQRPQRRPLLEQHVVDVNRVHLEPPTARHDVVQVELERSKCKVATVLREAKLSKLLRSSKGSSHRFQEWPGDGSVSESPPSACVNGRHNRAYLLPESCIGPDRPRQAVEASGRQLRTPSRHAIGHDHTLLHDTAGPWVPLVGEDRMQFLAAHQNIGSEVASPRCTCSHTVDEAVVVHSRGRGVHVVLRLTPGGASHHIPHFFMLGAVRNQCHQMQPLVSSLCLLVPSAECKRLQLL
mmetsp:Transcript_56524/g.122882  ORF Transcript_56524/g.122882 Transcript_56524/m.122882 type:complete len:242 (+) Transcript_56524:270-995(+)